MDKFLEMYQLPILTQEGIGNMNRPITSEDIEWVILKLSNKQSPGLDYFTSEFYQALRELIPVLLKLFKETEEGITLPNSFLLKKYFYF